MLNAARELKVGKSRRTLRHLEARQPNVKAPWREQATGMTSIGNEIPADYF
jgi:hypothetical protein